MPTNYLNFVPWKEVVHLGENVGETPQRLSIGAFLHHFPLEILACHVVVPVMSLGREAVLMFSKLTVGLLLLSVSHTTSTRQKQEAGKLSDFGWDQIPSNGPCIIGLEQVDSVPRCSCAAAVREGTKGRSTSWRLGNSSRDQFKPVLPGGPWDLTGEPPEARTRFLVCRETWECQP